MLLIVVAAVLWGTSGATGRYLGQSHALSPLAISFYRLAIGALALLAFSPRRLTHPGSLKQTSVLVLVGIGMAVYQASFFVAVSLAGVSLATLVALGMSPVLVAVLSGLVLKPKQGLERSLLLSLLAAVAGLCLLVGNPTAAAANPLAGAALASLSAAGFACVTLFGRWLAGQVAPPLTTLWGFQVGAITLLPLALLTGLNAPDDLLAAGLLVYLGIGPTALAYSAFFLGMRWVVPSTSSVLTLVEPLTATLIAVIVFQEQLTAFGLVGGALMIVALVSLYLSPRAPAALTA
jgi:DME family drug/metabolite transporter